MCSESVPFIFNYRVYPIGDLDIGSLEFIKIPVEYRSALLGG
jgi:hypothetical protein